ncbi:MAG: serine protease [Pseudomonadota bacterium]
MWRSAGYVLAGTMLATMVQQAAAQDSVPKARYGAVTLDAGFQPDPVVVGVEAGGADEVGDIGPDCIGWVAADKPDYDLYYTAGDYGLGIFVRGLPDTTLIVLDPAGNWVCNDDHSALGGVNPGVTFDQPSSGRYSVWVGTYDADVRPESVELIFTEDAAPWEPYYGAADLAAGFQPDPHTLVVQAGGRDPAEDIVSGCAGFIAAARPDYVIGYTPGQYQLAIFAEGSVDATLVVQDPGGGWHCNDDFSEAGGTNPGLVFSDPPEGLYRIWTGVYDPETANTEITLIISEGNAPWGADTSSGPPPGDGSTLVGTGTGFFVSDAGHVLTNDHVIDQCNRLTLQVRGMPAVEAALIATNPAVDLAILQVARVPAAIASFRAGLDLRQGDEIVAYGFPLEGDLSSQGNVTVGLVSALSGIGDDLSRVQISAQVQPGNSGGPLMDRRGNIVGVVVARANDEFFMQNRGVVPQDINFAVRAGIARSFLSTNNVPFRLGTEASDLSIADITERAQDFTGLIRCYQ